ncbi:hypothetical protein [uncultured Muribaculum sp.]|uniref:hypothetical protein n=1 Tax=uncultured Muribaculum sp. TaxID=1918613 RepID=UPI0025D7D785|nr:hypothetical protein [uncultured Muribaculum sp.]
MKKFTLVTLAVGSILFLHAASPKVVNVVKLPQHDILKDAKTQMSARINAETTTTGFSISNLEKNAASPIKNNVSRVETNSEATIFPNYRYPSGALFPIWWVYQNQGQNGEEKIVGPVYFGLGNMLVPAGHEVTFPNFTYNSEGDFVQDASWEWQYETGIFHSQYNTALATSTDADLSASLAPMPIMNYGVDAPILAVGDQEFALGTTEQGEFYPLSINPGGNGGLNPGDESINATRYRLTNGAYRSWITNYSNADEVLGYSNVIGAGVDANGFYSGVSCNDLRNRMLADDLEAYGIDASAFYGYAQTFRSSSQGGVLSQIAMPTSVKAKAGSEITVTLYKIESEGEGDSAVDKYIEIASGIYTVDQDVTSSDLTFVTLDLFDEETEEEYIILEPNSLYLVLYSDIAGLDAFVPSTPQFSFDATDIHTIATADMQNRNGVFAMYLLDDGFAPVPVDFNWRVSETSPQRKYYPALPIELAISYPYITPMGVFTSSNTYNMIPAENNSVDAEIFSMGEDYYPMGVVVAYSDMSAEDLLNSVEYSSEDLKEKISLNVRAADDYTVPGQSVTFPSVERRINVYVMDDVPTGSWIKLHNYNQTLTINIPSYEFSGIGDIVADGEAVASEYFDLQGRKVAGEAKGIMIKKMTMADGSVKAVKVVK